MTFNSLQMRMIGQGAAVLLVGMLAGIGLLVSLLGGLELIPGTILEFSIPGQTDAWVRAHVGGMMNGFLILIVAPLLAPLGFTDAAAGRVYWMLVATGWANTIFYWAALLAPNRALSIADNKWGESNVFAVIGLVPALVGVGVSIIAVTMLMRQAFAQAKARS